MLTGLKVRGWMLIAMDNGFAEPLVSLITTSQCSVVYQLSVSAKGIRQEIAIQSKISRTCEVGSRGLDFGAKLKIQSQIPADCAR